MPEPNVTRFPGGPEGLLAARLVERVASGDVLAIPRDAARAGALAEAARALAPDLAVLLLPSWDCLPYDRASPSHEVMGARMAVLNRLANRDEAPILLIASAEAAGQRLPPSSAHAGMRLETGAPFDPEAFARWLERTGHAREERVNSPGEAALHGETVDVFPADAALPLRLRHAEGLIAELHWFDPASQRSLDECGAITLGPASELVLPEDSEERHSPGLEHALPDFHPDLVSVFDLLPKAAIVIDPEVAALRAERLADIEDAHRSRLALAGRALSIRPGARMPPAPDRLYLDEAAWRIALEGRELAEAAGEEAGLPDFAGADDPGADDPEDVFLDFLEERIAAGFRVALAGPRRRALPLLRLAEERLGLAARKVAGWMELRSAPSGSLALMDDALAQGFVGEDAAVIAPEDVRPRRGRAASGTEPEIAEAGLRPGDAVIHFDHGLGVLRGIEPVEVDGARADCLRLEYAGGSTMLVPFDEIDRLWHYGGEAESLSLDHLNTGSWAKRRAEAEAQIAEAAKALAKLARTRGHAAAPALRPPAAAMRRFAARFPHPPTSDQESAIRDVLGDLASGHPMDRLVCGDVGFGKTEVALRAAAAAVFSGKQVALLAPTTVLVRQHLATFRRRFAGHGVRIEQLSRLSGAAEARAVKAGLASGEIGIVIGTQALAGKGVGFADLGLLIIDEEQRFGARQKAMLRRLGDGVHALTMTATPIPRTLQSALIGLQELSTIATPPVRRQPIRTTVLPFDEVVVREALRREQHRDGQSFIVCPRIEDIDPMRERLTALLPGIALLEAHGGMPPGEVDEAMIRFAEGDADALLCTNIVETGLDVPRANTMLIWRPDRFGLAQLHQLRGRVGRGRAGGVVYLLTDPDDPPAAATLKRLRTLEALDRVGAGFSVSARDMDLRGAGDLLGETQAGHLKLIGLELYQHLLDQALRRASGEVAAEEWMPALTIALDACIPADYVAEEALRVELYTRLGALLRRGDDGGLSALAEEIEDRFGPPPEPVERLIARARLRMGCRRLGIAKLEVGPAAAAASFRGKPPAATAPLELHGERLILRKPSHTSAQALAVAAELIAALQPGRRKRNTKLLPEKAEALAGI
ncbi:MAG TPA: DEAD/DEAH box helicase [Acetobacteraceae bacterium]|nr:DEAD/DEAH box helicase [Acetobacteraceae bacterium]